MATARRKGQERGGASSADRPALGPRHARAARAGRGSQSPRRRSMWVGRGRGVGAGRTAAGCGSSEPRGSGHGRAKEIGSHVCILRQDIWKASSDWDTVPFCFAGAPCVRRYASSRHGAREQVASQRAHIPVLRNRAHLNEKRRCPEGAPPRNCVELSRPERISPFSAPSGPEPRRSAPRSAPLPCAGCPTRTTGSDRCRWSNPDGCD
ncbi:hypothetical protein ATI53_101931 [Salipiger aestuarii]|uniref:Uncharacterized protein n=1 Tax=Salipiger aestuarii TaxID=568098 RepID=A0A327Y869_9RHOB|nr:hypothetical protein ATI53_101931 [Salipiger aestuarii]